MYTGSWFQFQPGNKTIEQMWCDIAFFVDLVNITSYTGYMRHTTDTMRKVKPSWGIYVESGDVGVYEYSSQV